METAAVQPLSWFLRDDISVAILSQTTGGPAADDSKVYQYQENDYLDLLASVFPVRIRILFEREVQSQVKDWLRLLPASFAISMLSRENSLIGFEIAAKHSLGTEIRQFPVQLGAEIIEIHQALPSLRTPGLLVMDMDSTAIKIECIDELAKMAGVGEEVAAVTALAMQGELDFEQSLRQRVGKLNGAPASIIDELCQSLPLMPGLEVMINELKSHGWRLVLASGGFSHFVDFLQHKLTLDAAFANQLVIQDGILQGEVTGTVVDAAFKAKVLSECAQRWQIAPGQTLAIGDGANDIPMIERADFGIAFHGKAKLVNAADAAVNQLDLRALVFLLQD
ncbi:phosphoserine phosphatase SerB [Shewanella sp. SR44-3]|uniref:phosphoserine phosphatase SerB n=1 Tax=unclassified Shewanella TaxID=196818 RepID=UPI0015FA1BC5|nr:phosphoserine phosphatase SerB [Shewanella sp. SR44-3]MBB1270184.1 phosphoserine phosphatase SerB [Shewanella sp. SR44-3]